jgi:hypothetical protein
MLRAFFVNLSENRSLRNFAERSAIGRRVSGRFVAGTEIADAVRVTQAVNRAGMSVSIDNLGENVTNPEEARHSAPAAGRSIRKKEQNKRSPVWPPTTSLPVSKKWETSLSFLTLPPEQPKLLPRSHPTYSALLAPAPIVFSALSPPH